MVGGAQVLQQRGLRQNPKHTHPRHTFTPNALPDCPGNSRCWENGCLSRPFTRWMELIPSLKFQTFLHMATTETRLRLERRRNLGLRD